jgi:hypothetical protein
MHKLLLVGFACGCGGNGLTPVNNFDFSTGADLAGMPSGTTDGAAPDGGSGTNCASYTKSSIAAMRQAQKSGCFELDNVVTIATTPISAKSTSIRIVAQDPMGGDYSAVVVNCSDSMTTKYPCTAFPTAKNILAGRSVTIQGFYAKASAAKGGYEDLSLDSITDNGTGTAPAAATLMLADIERGASKPASWFQKVTVTVSAADTLRVFDFTPPELKSQTASASGCGGIYGFGMLPKSATGTAGAACSGTMQPAGQTMVNANEVLIGTDFHGTFTANSECGCISAKTSAPYPGLISASSTLSGSVSGILFYDANNGVGYQLLAPLKDADAPITNLSK